MAFYPKQLENGHMAIRDDNIGVTAIEVTKTGSVITNPIQTAAGATLTLTTADFGKIVKLDTAAGSVVTLPAATGSGGNFTFVVSALATSNSHIVKVANATDTMQGIIFSRDDTSDNAVAFAATAGTSDTITLNRTTTGSVVIGETITVQDFASGIWQVLGFITNSGTPATPFSATVS